MPFAAVLAAVLVLVGSGGARADELRTALDRLQQRYDATKTMKADFKQVVESPSLAGTLESKGTVAFEKPNRMRWDYAAPDPQLIVGDGTTLWVYQPDLKQVIKAPLTRAFQSSTPVTFLAGLGSLERDFEAKLEKDEGKEWLLRLTPRKQEQGLGTLFLAVRKSDASVAEARITDPVGTTTRILFSDEERNVALAADLFRFIPPDGVDVVAPPSY
ncbi:MAG: outer membrane lipoprotein chaperone LolA [bacterium]|nr:outer membrane lipoprotein chaperone LolA [bacterium]